MNNTNKIWLTDKLIKLYLIISINVLKIDVIGYNNRIFVN